MVHFLTSFKVSLFFRFIHDKLVGRDSFVVLTQPDVCSAYVLENTQPGKGGGGGGEGGEGGGGGGEGEYMFAHTS